MRTQILQILNTGQIIITCYVQQGLENNFFSKSILIKYGFV